MPVVTRNQFGQGEAWYVGTSPEASFLQGLLGQICEARGINPILPAVAGVEAVKRTKNGQSYVFVLNHNAEARNFDLGSVSGTELLTGATLSGSAEVAGRGVLIIEEAK
jgi:beta-galactosidase